jgi:hypothetical protein
MAFSFGLNVDRVDRYSAGAWNELYL